MCAPNWGFHVSYLWDCEEGLGATGPYISDTASQYVTADKPETTATFIIY